MSWLVALAACGGGGSEASVVMDVGTDAPAFGRAPFPTDALRDGDRVGTLTGLELVARGESDKLAAHVASLDGFGLRPTIDFFTDGPLDPASLPATTAS